MRPPYLEPGALKDHPERDRRRRGEDWPPCREWPASKLVVQVPRDLFGLPQDGICVNTEEVVCPARIYRFPWQRLRERMVREPQLQLNVLVRVAYDLRQAQRQIMILGSRAPIND
jgi:hypothetical protein